MGFLQNKSTRGLIMTMVALVLIGSLIAKAYYSGINKSADPRVKPARELYGKYNSLAQANNYTAIFELLDSVESIYEGYPHYSESYEVGVVCNNRAAAWLTLALYKDSLPNLGGNPRLNSIDIDSLLILSEEAGRESIRIYEKWNDSYKNLSPDEMRASIEKEFMTGLESYTPEEKEKYLNSRLKELEDARWETDRRLSVAFTNLGLVYRQRNDLESAAKHYTIALDYWEDNLSAENNLNRLLGKPLRKRNFIQKMFPKQRSPKKKEK